MQGLKRVAVICAATVILAGCGGGGPPKTVGGHDAGPTQKVHLVWKQATNSWKVNVGGGDQDPKDAKTHIGKGAGPTLIIVDIQGPTNATFKISGGLSVWVGDKLVPPAQPAGYPDQILGPIVTKNGKEMIFYDLNRGDEVTLNYQLYFNQPGVPPVDPIIENGGGNWL